MTTYGFARRTLLSRNGTMPTWWNHLKNVHSIRKSFLQGIDAGTSRRPNQEQEVEDIFVAKCKLAEQIKATQDIHDQ